MTERITEFVKALIVVYRNYLKRVALIDAIRNYLLILIVTFIVAFLFPALKIESLSTLLTFAMVLLLANIFISPIVNVVFLKLTVMSFGLFSILLNAVIFAVLINLKHGVSFDGGLFMFIVVDLVFAFLFSVISSFISSTPMDNFELMFLKSIAEDPDKTRNTKGLYFLEIDGLSEDVLEYAMENGYAKTLKKWKDESHTLIQWESDLSSQTSASQAGILHGDNSIIPAFRWFDRKKQKVITSNNFKDAKYIQKQISNGEGILANNGISFNNMFDGDSPESSLNIADFGTFDERREAMKLYFVYPQAFTRTLAFTFVDFFIEVKDAMFQQIKNVQPRIQRHLSYMFLRPITTVFLRDLGIYRVMESMMSGAPTLYTTFVGYDEVAHHAGIKDKSALNVLRRLDDQFAKLDYMKQYLKGDFKFVVLSDHGQSQGWTFKQRFGYSLDDFIQKQVGDAAKSFNKLDEEHQHDLQQTRDIILRKKKLKEQEEGQEEPDKVISMASGNHGLIFFTGFNERLTEYEIEELHPGLLEALYSHKGIQFILVKTKDKGSVAMNNYGKIYLDSGKVEGKNPLKVYNSKNTLELLRRYDKSPNVPDIMVMSMFDPNTEEVAAFEELVGNHGGLGGPQSRPFILFPNVLKAPDKELVGAHMVYETIKGWLDPDVKPIAR